MQQIEIYNDFFLIHLPFKRQPRKMVKQTQTIRAWECLTILWG